MRGPPKIILSNSHPGLAYSPDKIGLNWRKLDKSGENWRKLVLTIEGQCKSSSFPMDLIQMHY